MLRKPKELLLSFVSRSFKRQDGTTAKEYRFEKDLQLLFIVDDQHTIFQFD